jgi:hypothetical protein
LNSCEQGCSLKGPSQEVPDRELMNWKKGYVKFTIASSWNQNFVIFLISFYNFNFSANLPGCGIGGTT